MMLNAATQSNLDRSVSSEAFALNKQDVNLEWNVWLEPNLKTTNLSSDFATLGAIHPASTNR
jgi:hypothetical protein